MNISQFKNKVTQLLYKPSKSKIISKDTIGTFDELERAIDEVVTKMSSPKSKSTDDEK